MIEIAALTALLLATTPTPPESANGFATPSPSVIEQLRSQNSRLDELRADPNANSAPAPRGLVAWDRIDRLSKRGNSAGKGALSGGAAFGLLGGMIGAAAVSVANGNATPTTAFMGGALAGGAFGAVLGGLIGTAFPAWHVIYRRPADALRASRR